MNDKSCRVCATDKPLELFQKDPRTKSGYAGRCLSCASIYKRRHYEANREHVLAVNRAWRVSHPEAGIVIQKRYYEAHPERRAEASRAWKERNIDRCKASRAIHREKNKVATKVARQKRESENKEKYARLRLEYKLANPEAWRASQEKHRLANLDRFAAKEQLRRAKKINATPAWLTPTQKAEMLGFYTESRAVTEQTGVEHEVDHIVPLRGRLVCGLHVPWNLQVITASQNASKGNRFSPESSPIALQLSA